MNETGRVDYVWCLLGCCVRRPWLWVPYVVAHAHGMLELGVDGV